MSLGAYLIHCGGPWAPFGWSLVGIWRSRTGPFRFPHVPNRSLALDMPSNRNSLQLHQSAASDDGGVSAFRVLKQSAQWQKLFKWFRARRIGEASNPGPDSQARGSKQRPRGKRPVQVDLVLFNSSGSRQMGNAMAHYGKQKGAKGLPTVAAIICQEHKLRGDGWVDFKHKSKKHGWTVKRVQAIKCEERSSAGVCIAVSSGFDSGARMEEMSDEPQEHPDIAGRIASV